MYAHILANCLLPGATSHIVTTGGTASTSAAGTSGTLSCGTGYSGIISSPLCSSPGGTWTYNGTCIAGEGTRTHLEPLVNLVGILLMKMCSFFISLKPSTIDHFAPYCPNSCLPPSNNNNSHLNQRRYSNHQHSWHFGHTVLRRRVYRHHRESYVFYLWRNLDIHWGMYTVFSPGYSYSQSQRTSIGHGTTNNVHRVGCCLQ